MASSTPDGSVNYDMTDSSSRGWIVCEEQNEAQSNVSSVTSLHAAREWARSTETEGSLLGITCNVAGDPGIDTEASAAAMAIQQEMQQQEVIEKPEKNWVAVQVLEELGGMEISRKKLRCQVRGGKT